MQAVPQVSAGPLSQADAVPEGTVSENPKAVTPTTSSRSLTGIAPAEPVLSPHGQSNAGAPGWADATTPAQPSHTHPAACPDHRDVADMPNRTTRANLSNPPDLEPTWIRSSPTANGLPHYRTIVALDIECSTTRPDPVKAELRNNTYELFDAALCSAGIHGDHRDRFIDRGDGVLALIHPVDQAPKTLVLNHAIPSLNRLLTDHNASLPPLSRLQRQLRVRVVIHAGEVHYDANGCFGEALDVAFRLLDASRVKKALRTVADPLILVISGDIYSSVVRHGYDGIDQQTFHPLVRVQVAGKRYRGWIHIPEQSTQYLATQMTAYRRPRLT
jgi:hypothetical protein